MFVSNRHVTSRGSRRPRQPRSRLTPHRARVILVAVRPSCFPGRRRARWCAGALLVAVLGGCGTGAAAPHSAAPAPVSTVVSQARGAVEHVTRWESSYGVYGDYSIYLPAGYGQDPRRRYPVVYLLHGGSDTDSFFLELGAREAMDAGVRSGGLGPMILVMVDGGPTFTGDGSVSLSFDDYLVSDLMPDVDRRWRTVAERSGRAIGGISLGGRHALEFAADHPSLVVAVGGHSATMPRSPERLAAAGIPIYLDVGTGDGLFASDEALAMSLRRDGVDVRWHPAAGEHGRPYWSAHLPDYLRFYSQALGATGG
jgi:enterochelin esterase-like enzyme